MNRHYTRAPHRGAASSDDYVSPNAALLIDFDNVTMAIRSNLAQELHNLLNSDMIRGKVAVQRAYADWRRYPQYIVPLSESSIDLIFAPAYGSSKKNATDIRLAIDALELVFTRPEIGTFILLSGDSDFSSLVLKLKEYGKYVIGVGMQESSSDILVQNCDEYYSYSSLSGLREASEVETQRHDPWDLVERALRKMRERDDVMRSDRLKQVMLELDPSFDEGAIGFSKFNRFLTEAASRHKVKLRKAANGQYEVGPADGGGGGEATVDRPRVSHGRQERSRSGGTRKRRPSRPEVEEGGRESASAPAAEEAGPAAPSGDALREAYDLLAGAVESLAENGDPVRDSEVKRRILSRVPDFDEAELGFRKFSRFLQQAHDEGVIDLRQEEDGNYYLTAPGGRRGAPAARAGAPAGAAAEAGSAPARPGSAEDREREESAPETAEEPPSERDRGGARGRAAAGRTADRSRRSARRGLGRFRPGSRAGPAPAPGAASDGPGGIGPVEVDEPDSSGDGAPEPAAAAESASPGRSGGDTSADGDASAGGGASVGGEDPVRPAGGRGGLGRFRRGSRAGGRARPGGEIGGADRSPSGGGPVGGGNGEAAGSAGAADSREIVDHMVRNYPGVGERTAARLVEEFGDGVLEVIDREPERVKDLLSERRARAVIEAREAEKASE